MILGVRFTRRCTYIPLQFANYHAITLIQVSFIFTSPFISRLVFFSRPIPNRPALDQPLRLCDTETPTLKCAGFFDVATNCSSARYAN